MTLSSPPHRGQRGEFHTPARVRIRTYSAAGLSQSQIKRKMFQDHGIKVSQPTISRIIQSEKSRRDQSGRIGRPRKLTTHTAQYIARMCWAGWNGQRMTYKRLAKALFLNVSHRTIARALKLIGYRRCIACRQPFINQNQQRRHVHWAIQHMYWTVNNWARVIWSDECSFVTGERGRIWITRHVG